MTPSNQSVSRLVLAGLVALAGVGFLAAQETRHETVNPSANTADDAKPNSDAVPDVYSVPTDFERVITLRFKHKADLLAGLQKAVKQENIRNAVILSGLGSVISYHVHQVSNRTFPSKNVYVKDPTGAADLLTMTGYVIGGRVHAHVTLSTPEKAFGGHLEPGTEVFTFAIVTIGVLSPALDLSRLDDKAYR